MPDGASIERRKMLRLMGAKVELTPAKQGMAGAIARANACSPAPRMPGCPRQFDNPANPDDPRGAPRPRRSGSTPAGQVDIVVAGIGTGGTLTGIARALKPRRPSCASSAVEPTESAVLSGDDPGPHAIQGIGAGFTPAVLDLSCFGWHSPGQRARTSLAAARALRHA